MIAAIFFYLELFIISLFINNDARRNSRLRKIKEKSYNKRCERCLKFTIE